MDHNRNGETGNIPTRHSRFKEQDGYWHYCSREGVKIGPFDSQQEAEAGVGEFIDFLLAADPSIKEAVEQYLAA